MKKHNYKLIATVFIFAFLCIGVNVFSQEAKSDLLLNLGYFNNNNSYSYLKATAKTKVDGKFQLVKDVTISFYINKDSSGNLLGKAVTNDKGEAILLMPPSAKDIWNKSAKQSFVIVSTANKNFDETKANADITKAKLQIDTAENKTIKVKVIALKDTAWIPVKGVELKVAIKRMDGDLNVSETQTYTTDSTGAISAEFKRDTLPGDVNSNLILVAKVEDNDQYGNLSVEKSVPWGAKFNYETNFFRRSLFARRGQSPLWFEIMAYSIIVLVWGVVVYLLLLLNKIKKMGKA